VLLLRGVLRQTYHLFDAALADLGQVLATQPLNAQALLTRAVIHEVRAEYAMARTDCGAAAFRVGQAARVACLAGATSLTGHATVTLTALKLSDADAGSSTEERLWALTVEGEVAARLGRAGQAEDAFARARTITSDDSYLLGAYADRMPYLSTATWILTPWIFFPPSIPWSKQLGGKRQDRPLMTTTLGSGESPQAAASRGAAGPGARGRAGSSGRTVHRVCDRSLTACHRNRHTRSP
jgi:hypothetical protein